MGGKAERNGEAEWSGEAERDGQAGKHRAWEKGIGVLEAD